MGCINSTNKKLYTLKRDDVFNVSVIRVQSEQSVVLAKQGFLEINPQELIFLASEQEPVTWALQHLRRYGLNGNIISFEAGRRCPTGPGIYTFRCCNAGQFYIKFQRYINSMTMVGDRNNSSTHHSHIFERINNHQAHTNHYLEPTSVQIPALLDGRPIYESSSNDFNNLDLNLPDSIYSSSVTTEIIHFPPNVPSYSNTSPNPQNSSSNIYMEQPVRSNNEHNNNIMTHENINYFNINNSTVPLKPLLKSASLDVPPEECAPILATNSIETKLYENIDARTSKSKTLQNFCSNISDRCYANVDFLSRLDLSQSNQRKPFQVESQTDLQQHTISNGPIVNYIILDLDQPRSPSLCSPKNAFGSGDSLAGTGSNIYNLKKDDLISTAALLNSGSSTMPKGTSMSDKLQNNEIESSGSYTRIDFLKTFALMKSSTNYADFDIDNDQEESRITRHSKFVRKAYSISE
ncbi:uncharacterized protein ACRADG_006178 [Cochliomyia hominivorax]